MRHEGIDLSNSKSLLVATTNPKKGTEMAQILSLAGLDLKLVTLADFPSAPPVEETGETFAENARLKAVAGVRQTGITSIADDGGLVIDALGGRPGVHSHRFLGADTSFVDKMEHILELLRGVPDARRTCRFRCAVAVMTPDGRVFESEGVCEGRIAQERRGANGFGYDPIFVLPDTGRHMAELTPEEKHAISHRGKALAAAMPALRSLYSTP